MSDLYLIAHKVRGLTAFDVACRCECPECMALGCPECDDLGYWWIVPTSGHRAYPSDYIYLWAANRERLTEMASTVNDDLPDHYPHRAAPTLSLTQALGLDKPATRHAPIPRRF